jgi:hypothetical protein
VEAQKLGGRQLLVEERAVRDEAERALGFLGLGREVVAVDRNAARGRLQQTGDHPDRGGLAGAVRAQEAVDLARPHVEADAVDRAERAEGLDQ